jgi:hypothetical protein
VARGRGEHLDIEASSVLILARMVAVIKKDHLKGVDASAISIVSHRQESRHVFRRPRQLWVVAGGGGHGGGTWPVGR